MSLRKSDRKNFDTLIEAMKNGNVALVESRCAKTGEYRALVCAMGWDGENHIVSPFAQMVTGNPYEDYLDPTANKLPKAR